MFAVFFALIGLMLYNLPHMEVNILYVVFTAVALIFVIWIIRLEFRIHRLCAGKNGKSLEDGITALGKGVEDLYGRSQASDNRISDLRARFHKSVQRVETIRFNPFKGDGSGGNQSFVSAFADEDGNGVILSCLYSRGAVNVYAKPMKKFTSEINLSEEEKTAVEKLKIN